MKYGDIIKVGKDYKCRSDTVKPNQIKGKSVWPTYTATSKNIVTFTSGQKLEFVKPVLIKRMISKTGNGGKNIYTDINILIYRYEGWYCMGVHLVPVVVIGG